MENETGTTQESIGENEPQTEAGKASREAARYRTERNQLRDELTQANERIERYQRAEVERLASELAEPSDVFALSGKAVSDFLGESGDIDPEAVSAAIADIVATRPGLRRIQRATDPTQALGGPHKNAPTWGGLFS